MYFDVAKHLYDVAVMFELSDIQSLLMNRDVLTQMIKYKRLEETRRSGSNLSNLNFVDFQIFNEIKENDRLINAYDKMQRNYIYTEKDILPYDYIIEKWNSLKKILFEHDKAAG